MKVAILVDSLVNKGGVERVVLTLAKHFKADIIAGRYNPKTTFEEYNKLNIKVLQKSPEHNRIKSIQLKKLFKNLRLKEYDAYIFAAGGAALNAAKNHAPNVWWCIAPQIWLYDQYEEEKAKLSFPKNLVFPIMAHFLRKKDQENVLNINKIIAISKNVRNRIKKAYNRTSTVIYPNVDLSNTKYKKTGDFYLSTARLTQDKRIDVIANAFIKMPEEKLIIIGGGTHLKEVKKISEGHKNIEVLGLVSEKKLASLYSNCRATVYASLYEDLGLVAVESMSAGKPVIAPGDLGFKEMVINGKTGILIKGSEESIINAVKILDAKKAKSMRKACEKRSKDFTEQKFLKKMDAFLKKMVK